jgi:hypothetical protein
MQTAKKQTNAQRALNRIHELENRVIMGERGQRDHNNRMEVLLEYLLERTNMKRVIETETTDRAFQEEHIHIFGTYYLNRELDSVVRFVPINEGWNPEFDETSKLVTFKKEGENDIIVPLEGSFPETVLKLREILKEKMGLNTVTETVTEENTTETPNLTVVK